jgi:cytochrome P450
MTTIHTRPGAVVRTVLGASGHTEPIHVHGASILVASVVTAIDGPAAQLEVFADQRSEAGVWSQVAALTAQTSPGTETTAVMTSTPSTHLRLRWSLPPGVSASVLLVVAGA